MEAPEPLGLSPLDWAFLAEPDRYVEESKSSGRPLLPESTKRQFATAKDILERLNGESGSGALSGILLADDVGLGKTTVAALVAWVIASSGPGRTVRILVPNDVMVRRWEDELRAHIGPLNARARRLDVDKRRVKVGRVGRLKAPAIQVVKHSYASQDLHLACDLLIVDEAHRAKGETSQFSKALKRQRKHAKRVLILTATPFSIRLEELKRMLELIGDTSAGKPVQRFSRALDSLYQGDPTRDPAGVAVELASRAAEAVEALAACTIRHGIDELPREQAAFGNRADWDIDVAPAGDSELELMMLIDRASRLARVPGSREVTNDARFHVGWRFLRTEHDRLRALIGHLDQPRAAVLEAHVARMQELLDTIGPHPKVVAVGKAVRDLVSAGEKVLLFCHHHYTAQELTAHLAKAVPRRRAPASPSRTIWRQAWNDLLPGVAGGDEQEMRLRRTFLEWLCTDAVRAQTASWLSGRPSTAVQLRRQLKDCAARGHKSGPRIAAAACMLLDALRNSPSSRKVLLQAFDEPESLPGGRGYRVLGVCEPSEFSAEDDLFIRNQQPDTVIAIFNSPFGPDALVVTDRLSEGIDLHRHCRHLVHYELDPSPIRTVQRNGRLRRVNSWASATQQPLKCAYPAFRGTRDHRLVQIMKKRIDSFSLLLGGVQDFEVDEVTDEAERWRNEVLRIAKDKLKATASRLSARR